MTIRSPPPSFTHHVGAHRLGVLVAEPGEPEAARRPPRRPSPRRSGRLPARSPRGRAWRSRRRSRRPGPSCRARRGPRPRRPGARPTRVDRPLGRIGEHRVRVREEQQPRRRRPRPGMRATRFARSGTRARACTRRRRLEVGAQELGGRVSFPGGLTVSRRISSCRSSVTSSRTAIRSPSSASILRHDATSSLTPPTSAFPAAPAREPAAARARSRTSSGSADRRARIGACAGDRRGPRRLGHLLRAAGQRQDHAGAHRRGHNRRRLRGALRRLRHGLRRARRRSPGRRSGWAPTGSGRSSSSTRSIASTRRSRTRCCPPSRRGS